MSSSSIALLLAAGKGTRMRSSLPKPVVPFCGRPLILSLIRQFQEAGIADIYLVIGHGAETVREVLGNEVRYLLQEHQQGTAHAVEQALPLNALPAEHLFVCVGDSPLLRAETLQALEAHHRQSGASCTFLTAHFPVKLPYARVVRDAQGRVTACVEERNADAEQLAIDELLSSHFIFRKQDLFDHLQDIQPDPSSGERYLTDIIGIFLSKGLKVETVTIDDYVELVGLNTPEELQWAETIVKQRLERT